MASGGGKYIWLCIIAVFATIIYYIYESSLFARLCMGLGCVLLLIGCYQGYTREKKTDETNLTKRKRKVLICLMSGLVIIELIVIFIFNR